MTGCWRQLGLSAGIKQAAVLLVAAKFRGGQPKNLHIHLHFDFHESRVKCNILMNTTHEVFNFLRTRFSILFESTSFFKLLVIYFFITLLTDFFSESIDLEYIHFTSKVWNGKKLFKPFLFYILLALCCWNCAYVAIIIVFISKQTKKKQN